MHNYISDEHAASIFKLEWGLEVVVDIGRRCRDLCGPIESGRGYCHFPVTRRYQLLFTTASRTALGYTQPPIQWIPVAIFLAVKRPDHEVDHSPPSNAELKNEWSYTISPIRLHGVVLS